MSKINPSFLAIVKDGKINFKDKESFDIFLNSLDGQIIEVKINKKVDSRTITQNKALHLYFRLVAEALNEAGLTIETVIKSFTMEHEWTKELVKELLWREAQRFAVKKESTTQLSKFQEIEKVYEIVNRFLAKLKVESIPFPSIESHNETLNQDA